MDKKATYVFGALLIALGVIFILSPKEVFESIVLFGGIGIIVFCVIGIIYTFFFFFSASSYLLGSFILGLIFGIILVANTDSAIKVVPVLLGIWLFITGLSTTLYMSKMNTKLVDMAVPITRLLLGLICFIAPVIPISIVGIYIGIVLVLSGINTITNVKNEEVVYKVKVKK